MKTDRMSKIIFGKFHQDDDIKNIISSLKEYMKIQGYDVRFLGKPKKLERLLAEDKKDMIQEYLYDKNADGGIILDIIRMMGVNILLKNI